MNRTKIEWTDYTSNPVKGYCPMACSYCYARAMYDRFGWNKTIREDVGAWHKGVDIDALTQPSRIFVGSTIELFHPSIPDEWIKRILLMVRHHPQHTFQFLTKRPENLAKWNPWPDNAWVGVTATSVATARAAGFHLLPVEAKVKFVSFEPVHERIICNFPSYIDERNQGLRWVIIGAETGNRKGKPVLADVHRWAGEIIDAADRVGIPLFLKDNLHWPEQRREWPEALRADSEVFSDEPE